MPVTQQIFDAIEDGKIESVIALLDADPGLLYTRRVRPKDDGSLERGSAYETPLQTAAVAGQLDIVKLLIDRGAEIYEIAQWGYPAVAHAAWEKQGHVVDYLLGEAAGHDSMAGSPTYGLGIDVNLAARLGWVEIVQRHLERDSLSVHRRGVIGETPLHWAVHNGHTEIVRALLDAGADLEADEIGAYGGKPLHWASEHEPHIVRLLLERGAKVDSRNRRAGSKEGFTPLMMCASQRNDCAECAQLLLDAGADPLATDAQGRTALDIAVQSRATRIEALLRAHKADGSA